MFQTVHCKEGDAGLLFRFCNVEFFVARQFRGGKTAPREISTLTALPNLIAQITILYFSDAPLFTSRLSIKLVVLNSQFNDGFAAFIVCLCILY